MIARCLVVIVTTLALLAGTAIADKLDEMIAVMDETVAALTATKTQFEESFATTKQKLELQKLHRAMLGQTFAARVTCLQMPEESCIKAMYLALEASQRELNYLTIHAP